MKYSQSLELNFSQVLMVGKGVKKSILRALLAVVSGISLVSENAQKIRCDVSQYINQLTLIAL